VILDGMGHDLSSFYWDQLVDEISTHAQGAPTNESFAGYRVAMNRSLRSWSAIVAVVGLLPLTFTGTPSAAAASAHSSCRAPRLTGLTVTAARHRAKAAGCQLRLSGAVVKIPTIQTIHTQNVRPGVRATLVTVAVNPLCPSSGAIGPPPGEPIMKPGPTELISGLFIEGGPFIYRSVPNCESLVGKSSGGTITITNSVGTVIANNMALSAGQLLYVNVTTGAYTISGVFSSGLKAGPITVNVPSGEMVRQDLVLDVP